MLTHVSFYSNAIVLMFATNGDLKQTTTTNEQNSSYARAL